jgi:DNA primase
VLLCGVLAQWGPAPEVSPFDGISGQGIVQKNVSKHFPDWVSRAEVRKQDGAVTPLTSASCWRAS